MTVRKKLQIMALHFILGFTCILFPILSDLWAAAILIYGTKLILRTKNETGYAHKFAIYIVGVELLFRNFHFALPYEFGKYAVMYFLILGRSVELIKQRTPNALGLYFLCLLPSIIFVDIGSLNENRKGILFNLSGPAELYFAAVYFYNRKFTLEQFKDLSFWLLCGLMVVLAAIYYRLPSLGEMNFELGANSAASGGFGPNQASSILGLGLLITSLVFVFDYSITGKKYIDGFFIMTFAVLGLLTFSRGGMFSAVLSVVAGYLLSLFYNKKALSGKGMALFISFAVLMLGAWQFVSNKTGNVLERRYKGETMETESIGRYSFFTGRDKLAQIDYEIFKDNILTGVGPGMATYMRVEYGYYHDSAAAHTELTRLLSEHGIFGLLALCILLFLPIAKFIKTPRHSPLNKIVIVIFYLLAISTMTHSAMRTAMVGFFYGLSFIDLQFDEPKESEEDEEDEVTDETSNENEQIKAPGIFV